MLTFTSSCKTQGSKAQKQQKAIEKRKARESDVASAKYEAALERHKKKQGPSGKARLENAQQHRKNLDERQGSKQGFWSRLFGKKEGPDCK